MDLERGIMAWRAGILPIVLSMNAQSQAAMFAATLLKGELRKIGKQVDIIRLRQSSPSPAQADLLQLDLASDEALQLMKELGNEDGHETYRWCQDASSHDGELLNQIFARMREVT